MSSCARAGRSRRRAHAWEPQVDSEDAEEDHRYRRDRSLGEQLRPKLKQKSGDGRHQSLCAEYGAVDRVAAAAYLTVTGKLMIYGVPLAFSNTSFTCVAGKAV